MANLITIDDFKTYKKISSQDSDPAISLIIGAVSDFVKTYTSRALIDHSENDKIEYFDATEYPEYTVDEFPLINVTEVATSIDGGITWVPLVEDTTYFVDLQKDKIISNTTVKDTKFVASVIPHKSGRVTYTGGYTVDQIPLDLQLACMDLVQYFRKEDYTLTKAMSGASQENPIVILKGSQLPAHIRRVLDLYRVL